MTYKPLEYIIYFEDYLADVEMYQRFAKRSRGEIPVLMLDRTRMNSIEVFHYIGY